MENSLSSLAFSGSIPEAISEAKMQRKLFVVYISGDDADSIRMESSTWNDQNVSDSVSKYCILLHLSEGSADAVNFSKIYPQKSVPSITSVGYNGVKLWQHEGFVTAEDLTSSLEKAYLSLHIQETTASMLSAALASTTSEPPASQASTVTSVEQGSSSSQAAPLSSSSHNKVSEFTPPEKVEEKRDPVTIVESNDPDQSSSISNCPPESTSNTKNTSIHVSIDSGNSERDQNGRMAPVETKANLSGTAEGPSSVSRESNLATGKNPNPVEDTIQNRPSSSNPNEVHLNIRLPNGTSIHDKFLVSSILRTVKDFVDKDHSREIGPYDLAIPYPRRVFNDQDLSKSLSELELLGRQALIAVPRGRERGYREGASMSRNQANATADASDGNNEGYVVFARRLLSYLNPFSYLGRGQDPSGPNPDAQSNVSRPERLNSQDSRNPVTSSGSESRSRRSTTSRFGSNIHTLNHDEDDDPRFGDRNAFWNGNSTEYGGGDNDGK